MSEPEDQRLSSYGFELPERLIAQRPVQPRHAARLLVVEPLAAAADNGATVGSGTTSGRMPRACGQIGAISRHGTALWQMGPPAERL